jgi:hypothetical protein
MRRRGTPWTTLAAAGLLLAAGMPARVTAEQCAQAGCDMHSPLKGQASESAEAAQDPGCCPGGEPQPEGQKNGKSSCDCVWSPSHSHPNLGSQGAAAPTPNTSLEILSPSRPEPILVPKPPSAPNLIAGDSSPPRGESMLFLGLRGPPA